MDLLRRAAIICTETDAAGPICYLSQSLSADTRGEGGGGAGGGGGGIVEADDRQVTTVFTVQPPFHHRHSTNPVS